MFVGYSLGALISCEVCRELQDMDSALPNHLYIAGHICPTYFGKDKKSGQKLYSLPPNEFKQALYEYNMIDEVSLKDKDFCDYFLPVIQHDLT
eukprot:UN05642